MGMGFVVMTLLMGTPSAALAAGTLTVDWPNYSRNLVAGMSYFIKWTPGNAGASVKIELLKAGKRTKWVTTSCGDSDSGGSGGDAFEGYVNKYIV